MNHLILAQPRVIRISDAGDHMPIDHKGKHAAIEYPDFGVQFAVNHGIAGYMNHADATARCAELKHAGGDGWILAPHVRFLLLTVDYSRCDPAADPELFPDAESRWYWTNHGVEWCGKDSDGAPRALWQVGGYYGGVSHGGRGYGGFVRPCRLVSAPGQ